MEGLSVFLLGGGLALFTALLGWGNSFKEPQENTKNLEKLFTEKLRIKFKKIIPLISNQTSFLSEIKSITQILTSRSSRRRDAHLIKKLKEIERKTKTLYDNYNLKYYLAVSLCVIFFSGGIVSAIFSNINLGFWNFTPETVSAIVAMIMIFSIIGFLIRINVLENDFRDSVKEFSDSIEAR